MKHANTSLVLLHHGLGDVIMATPLMKRLREKSNVVIIAQNLFIKDFLLHESAADRIFLYSTNYLKNKPLLLKETLSLLFQLRTLPFQFSFGFGLHGNNRLAKWLLQLAGCHQVFVPQDDYQKAAHGSKHKVKYWEELLSAAFQNGLPETASREEALFAPHEDRIIILPGSGQKFKELPAHFYVQLIQHLRVQYDVKLLILGGSVDRPVMDEIKDTLDSQNNISFQCQDASMETLKDNFSTARLIIGGDSGLMHLAHYFGFPILPIFGPTNWKWTGPPNMSSPPVSDDTLSCLPCQGNYFHACGGDIPCLRGNRVLENTKATVDQILNGSRAA